MEFNYSQGTWDYNKIEKQISPLEKRTEFHIFVKETLLPIATIDINNAFGLDNKTREANVRLMTNAADMSQSIIRMICEMEKNGLGDNYSVKIAKKVIEKALNNEFK